jgi:hypothetical protein
MERRPLTARKLMAASRMCAASANRLIRQANKLLRRASEQEAQARNIFHAAGLAKAWRKVKRETRRTA